MRWTDLPIVAFDTETTGLHPWEGHRIIEFAAVCFHLDEKGAIDEQRVETHQFLVNPGVPIPPEVQTLTGITNETIAGAPSFDKVAGRVRELLTNAVTVAHNYSFDQQFLSSEFQLLGAHWPQPLVEIDTVALSRRYFPEAHKHKLEDMARRVGVTLSGAHRAVNDADACGRSFLAIARRFEAPDELEGLLDWADAMGHPPATEHFMRTEAGVLFGQGPHRGRALAEHPDYLAWMLAARQHKSGEWRYRFPESVRQWAARWLRVRGAGRAPIGIKSFGPEDWAIDSCALPDDTPATNQPR